MPAILDTQTETETWRGSLPDGWASFSVEAVELEATPSDLLRQNKTDEENSWSVLGEQGDRNTSSFGDAPAITLRETLSRVLQTEGWTATAKQLVELQLCLVKNLMRVREEYLEAIKASAESIAIPAAAFREAVAHVSLRVEGLSETAQEIGRVQASLLTAFLHSMPIAFRFLPLKPSVADRLVKTLSDQPVEDGVSHPAEQILREGARREPQVLASWVLRLIRKSGRSTLSADILRCVARLNASEFTEWGKPLVESGLGHAESEVRDAAIQALELWATPDSFDLLRRHSDPVPWIQEYVDAILKEAEEQRST